MASRGGGGGVGADEKILGVKVWSPKEFFQVLQLRHQAVVTKWAAASKTSPNWRCLKLHHSYCNSFNLSNVGILFQELNSKGLYLSQQKEKENRRLVFPSSTQHEIRTFHVFVHGKEITVSLRRRQRERQKNSRLRLAKQQFCTCITLFCTFLCCHGTTTT